MRSDSLRTRTLALFLLIFAVHGYFNNRRTWDQNARLTPIFAFVEPGPTHLTFAIDRFGRPHDKKANARDLSTGDWVRHAGHLYSNKPPGMVLLGLPVYAVVYSLERRVGIDPTTPAATSANVYLLNLWVTVLWTAVACCVLFRYLAELWDWRDALQVALIYGFGTLVLPYDSSPWGHSTSAAAILIATCCLLRKRSMFLLAGVLSGVAFLFEPSALLPIGLMGLTLLVTKRTRSALRFAAGVLPVFLLFMAYQRLTLGSFFTYGYDLSLLNPIIRKGYPGSFFVFPSLTTVAEMLVMPSRGLLAAAPVLAFAVMGAWQKWRAGQRTLVAIAAGTLGGLILFFASMRYWWGILGTGTRYMVVSLPFFCLLLPRPGDLSRTLRWVFFAAALLSITNMLVIDAVNVVAGPGRSPEPIYFSFYRHLLSGTYPVRGGTNLGRLIGLPPLVDLLPLVVPLRVIVKWLLPFQNVQKQAPIEGH